MRPRLLDLFCGAGGAAMGYHRAGFDVLGVDNRPMPRYPFEFVQADAMTYPLDGFDAIHASPPCQAYTPLGRKDGSHPDLVPPMLAKLSTQPRPWVIENVTEAPMHGVVLCGSMFGLGVRRHRRFASDLLLLAPGRCRHIGHKIRAYYGKPGWLAWSSGAAVVNGGERKLLLRGSVEQAPADMGIDWMTWDELREAIPPSYTEFIGEQLLAAVAGHPARHTEEVEA